MPETLTGGTNTWVVAQRLIADRDYERPLNQAKVRKIAATFDPDALGVILVSQREDGTLVILDGQHRVAAVKALGWGDQKVPVHVYKGLTQAEEAALFVQYNEMRTRPRPLDIHRARLVAEDANAVGLNEVMAEHGLRFGSGLGIGLVRGIASFQTVYKQGGPAILGEALTVAKNAWGTHEAAFLGDNVYALGLLLSRYSTRIDSGRLARVLATEEPAGIVSKARVLKAQLGGTGMGESGRIVSLLAQLMAKLYNHRLHLQDRIVWEDRPARDFWTPVAEYEGQVEVRRSAAS